MTACTELLKREFPSIDDDLQHYVESNEIFLFNIFRTLTYYVYEIQKLFQAYLRAGRTISRIVKKCTKQLEKFYMKLLGKNLKMI